MLDTLGPRLDDHPLRRRIAALGGRLRVKVALRGTAWLIAAIVGGAAVVGLVDAAVHLPSFLRALALAVLLAGAGTLGLRSLVRPWREAGDAFALARRVERLHPEFVDVVSTAVEFLDHPDGGASDSPQLRAAAVGQALREVEGVEASELDDDRSSFRAAAAALIALVVAVPWLVIFPEASRTAMARLADPFGGHAWPPRTRVEALAPDRSPLLLPRGEALLVRVAFHGELPERAYVDLLLDGSPVPAVSTFRISDVEVPTATLDAWLAPDRIPRNFRFRVRAGDADSGWRGVHVRPAPVLVPLDGRPSPHVQLIYPTYTRLPAARLPDGTGIVDAIAGTVVCLRAATDRPVARAHVAYRPEQLALRVAPALVPLAGFGPWGAVALHRLAREVWAAVPVDVLGTSLGVRFVPRLPGLYELRFEDDAGMAGTRLLDMRVQPDPAPTLHLDRPSAGADALTLLPDAEFMLRIRAEDRTFGLRSVWVESSLARGTAPQRWVFLDPASYPSALALFGVLGPTEAANVRPAAWSLERRASLTRFRRPDGSPLREGDILILQAAADDHDDVTGSKPPGRSHEVELRVVSKATLEVLLDQSAVALRRDLLRLRDEQREARAKVRETLQAENSTGVLKPEDAEKLLQAEQAQQRIRARVEGPHDGLLAGVDRLRQSISDNRLPNSPTVERIEAMARGVDRLAREELPPIEPLLSEARKGATAAGGRSPLARAEDHQREVEETLGALLERLEPWSGATELRGEARLLAAEQRRMADQTGRLADAVPRGRPGDQLPAERAADLEREGKRQDALSDRARGLVEKLSRLARDKDVAAREAAARADAKESDAQAKAEAARAAGDAGAKARLAREASMGAGDAERARETAEALAAEHKSLERALGNADAADLDSRSREASDGLRRNQLGNAQAAQRAAADALDSVVEALRETPEADEAERLRKKVREAAHDYDDLIDAQDRLRKKAAEASRNGDAFRRVEEFSRLARDQHDLGRDARELAERLTRAKADEAAEALRQLSREMEHLADQLERGDPAAEAQEELLDRLDEARDALDRVAPEVGEGLQREKAGKLAELVQALRERQRAAGDEADRIDAAVRKARHWDRPLQQSLADLAARERPLAAEIRDLTEKRFGPLPVLAKLLVQVADAIELAVERIDDRKEASFDYLLPAEIEPEIEDRAHDAIRDPQRRALKRLDLVIDALKTERPRDVNARPKQKEKSSEATPTQGPADDLPPLAQLKAVRAWQADVLERTAAVHKQFPDPEKLPNAARTELDALKTEQREIADLFRRLRDHVPPPGDSP